jgi:hypothetical protein
VRGEGCCRILSIADVRCDFGMLTRSRSRISRLERDPFPLSFSLSRARDFCSSLRETRCRRCVRCTALMAASGSKIRLLRLTERNLSFAAGKSRVIMRSRARYPARMQTHERDASRCRASRQLILGNKDKVANGIYVFPLRLNLVNRSSRMRFPAARAIAPNFPKSRVSEIHFRSRM